jgi:hypothetical protein
MVLSLCPATTNRDFRESDLPYLGGCNYSPPAVEGVTPLSHLFMQGLATVVNRRYNA